MTRPSTALAAPAVISESHLYRVVEDSNSLSIQPAEIKSRAEPSKVVRVTFGEWPEPECSHPDSISVREFVQKLESEGHQELFSQARKEIGVWFDKKTTLRSLRLAEGLSQEQLAIRMKTSQSQVARIESGRQEMTVSTIKKLASALNISTHKVLDAAE